jgi:hypothetical protein
MHKALLILLAVAGVAIAISFGAIAYRAVTHDWDDRTRVIEVPAPSADQPGAPGEVVRVVDDDGWGHRGGFFPGFFFIPLLFFLAIVLIAWGLGRGGRGGWWDGPPSGGGGESRFEDWHRRQHERDNQAPNQQARA